LPRPGSRAAEPEFRLKFGNIVSGDHPLNTLMAKAGERIKNETDGRVTIEQLCTQQFDQKVQGLRWRKSSHSRTHRPNSDLEDGRI
jgi:hypothetical protein